MSYGPLDFAVGSSDSGVSCEAFMARMLRSLCMVSDADGQERGCGLGVDDDIKTISISQESKKFRT